MDITKKKNSLAQSIGPSGLIRMDCKSSFWSRLVTTGMCITLAVPVVTLSGCGASNAGPSAATYEKITEQFNNTTFDKLEFDEELGLIVGEAGATLVYFTEDGSNVIIGDIIDLKTGQDISADRRRVLGDKVSLQKRVFEGEGAKTAQAQPKPQAAGSTRTAQPSPTSKIEVDLPVENMAVLNEGGEHVVHVVSDFNCGFCKKLYSELTALDYNLEIREIPTGIYGRQRSSLLAAQVLCSDDIESAVDAAYKGTDGSEIVTCEEGERKVAENTEWARKNGVTGTPMVIMPDGSVVRGANMPVITQWLQKNT